MEQRIKLNGKNEVFNFRLTTNELASLQKIAQMHGVNKSEFVRQAILSIIKYVNNEK